MIEKWLKFDRGKKRKEKRRDRKRKRQTNKRQRKKEQKVSNARVDIPIHGTWFRNKRSHPLPKQTYPLRDRIEAREVSRSVYSRVALRAPWKTILTVIIWIFEISKRKLDGREQTFFSRLEERPHRHDDVFAFSGPRILSRRATWRIFDPFSLFLFFFFSFYFQFLFSFRCCRCKKKKNKNISSSREASLSNSSLDISTICCCLI